MRSLLTLIGALTALVLSEVAAAVKADFFVSPRGSDVWSGTLAEPSSAKKDGPFATLERARDAVRTLKKNKSEDIVVLVREGRYQLADTVVFGLEDSGAEDATVTYAAYPEETPVFSSGREIPGWKKVTRPVAWIARSGAGKDFRGRCLGLLLHPFR